MSLHVATSFVSPHLLTAAPGWSPAYFVGPAAHALQASIGGVTVAELGGRLIEGWRVSETSGAEAYDPRAATSPIYRQSNVGRLHLLLTQEHWGTPQLSDRWCVQPGDVVLNKLAPIRAALVPLLARRHPVDGNAIIVRGLPRAIATWLAVCLNGKAYEQLLLIEAGVLRRVGLGALSTLRLPPVPPRMEALSATLHDLLDEAVPVGEDLHRTLAEAAVAAWLPESRSNLRSGVFFGSSAMSSDSWLPSSVALRSSYAEIAARHDWIPLRDLVTTEDRTRFQQLPDGSHVIRLSDVGDDLFVSQPAADAEAPAPQPGRTLSKPLLPGEVLVSTLATSPRVAYVDESVPAQTFPIDSWVRLRFRETPAAWALLLSTPAIRRQIGQLAVGTAQQFVPPEALLSVHVPAPARATRDRWQHAVERHHAKRREFDRRWSSVCGTLMQVFNEVHGIAVTRPSSARGAAGGLQ